MGGFVRNLVVGRTCGLTPAPATPASVCVDSGTTVQFCPLLKIMLCVASVLSRQGEYSVASPTRRTRLFVGKVRKSGVSVNAQVNPVIIGAQPSTNVIIGRVSASRRLI